MTDIEGSGGEPQPRRRWPLVGGAALVAIVALGGVAVITWSSDDPEEVPSPLFDEVEQLTPTELPAHCWAEISFLTIGTTFDSSTLETTPRTYIRAPAGALDAPDPPDPLMDLDTSLPPTAVDTGYSTQWADAVGRRR